VKAKQVSTLLALAKIFIVVARLLTTVGELLANKAGAVKDSQKPGDMEA
jgi:hypothetical protein